MQDTPPDSEQLIGLEVKANRSVAVSIDRDGSLRDSFSIPNEEEKRLVQIGKAIVAAEERFGPSAAVGIALPGLIKKATGTIAFSENMPQLTGVDLVEEMSHYSDSRIVVENDANAAAYGEYVLGAGQGNKDIFYVTLGRGVGGALILNYKLWRGRSGFAGEFGHIAVNSEGMKLEDVASTANIIRRTKTWFHQDPTSSLNAVGEDNITIEDVIAAAENDDDFAQLMLQRTGSYVGTAIAGVINLLNIEKIIVGGDIMHAKHLVLDGIVQRARELSFTPSFEGVEIVEGALGENAAAIGAALLADRAAQKATKD